MDFGSLGLDFSSLGYLCLFILHLPNVKMNLESLEAEQDDNTDEPGRISTTPWALCFIFAYYPVTPWKTIQNNLSYKQILHSDSGSMHCLLKAKHF